MDRGDVLVFNTKLKKYKNWKYFRVIETLTRHNNEDGSNKKVTGSKMYLISNTLTKEGKVEKKQELFIADFFKLAQEGKANVADEADTALLFLTNTEF